MPYLSRAADRPQITHGVQSGDVGSGGGVVWARADRPSQMMVEVATTESFKNARALPPIAALPEIVELNIGHFLIGEAVFVGLEHAIRTMRDAMDRGRRRGHGA
mgnify:CR=1 FL=1